MSSRSPRRFGLGRGKVFPAADARSLINPLRRLVQSPRGTVDALQLDPESAVIEIGCGPGFFSPELAASVPRGRLVLFDLQPEMLPLARERLAGYTNVAYVAGDAQSLPFGGAQFDTAFLATMLGEVPDPTACLEEVHRILRPGGVMGIAETRRDSDFIGLAALRALVESRGFTFRSRDGIPWQYVACFTRR
jgi:ubiquinone/menaquinone biosynthesis C-methylase UbiE